MTLEKENDAVEIENSSSGETGKERVNSKVKCRHCGDSTLVEHTDYSDDGEALVSFLYCSNCGFNFPYFAKFEKLEKISANIDENLSILDRMRVESRRKIDDLKRMLAAL